MEPIIQYDRLEVLFADKLEYEVLIKSKDLKSHSVKPERKEEMLAQRVHIDSEEHRMLIICDLDPNFERHVDSRVESKQEDDQIDGESPERLITSED
jgi:hypothetical protein